MENLLMKISHLIFSHLPPAFAKISKLSGFTVDVHKSGEMKNINMINTAIKKF